MAKGELKALTSLRGLAAMAVVLQHFSATAAVTTAGWMPSLVPHGYMAVDFFFVLSGFVMALNYAAPFAAKGMSEYPGFLIRRVARLFPLGIVVTIAIAIGAGVAALWDHSWLFIPDPFIREHLPLALVINAAYLQGFLPDLSLNGPSGTVSLEFAAYVLFPAYLWAFSSRRFVGAATALCMAIPVLLCLLVPRGPVAADFARFMCEFGLGLAVYRAFQNPARFAVFGRDGTTWAISVVTLLGFALRSDELIVACCPFLVLAYALNRGFPSRILSAPPLHFLGLISFSLYLVHNTLRVPALAIVQAIHPAPLTTWEGICFTVVAACAVLPVAALTYYTVERPGRTAINRAVALLGRARMRFAAARERLSADLG